MTLSLQLNHHEIAGVTLSKYGITYTGLGVYMHLGVNPSAGRK